jgi:quinoprotein glucose dehydrogenase
MMSADPELGYVYLPTSTPTNDFYGGHRHGDNLFAESLVCVKAETGERVWHFQMVHHGLWDFDNPCAPNLIDITVDGKAIKAVAQVTKQGYTYVFDRVTGEPVWPIPELPVPASEIPGEKASPTQPHPTKPAAFAPQGVKIDDLIDFTAELRAKAIEEVGKFRYGGLFEPPSLHGDGTFGTIQRPSLGGAVNWNGAGVDPETGWIYIPARDSITLTHFYTPGADDGGSVDYTHGGRGPYPAGPEGLPLFKPPYSWMTAIDLNTGEHAWTIPLGEGDPAIRNHPALEGMELPALGGDSSSGPLVTKTLVITARRAPRGADSADVPPKLVAYDKKTGAEVGIVPLPEEHIGTPMTYLHEGAQYIALTVSTNPPSLVAYALPAE